MKNEDNESVKMSFSAVVEFTNGEDETFDVELSKSIDELTYDEVEISICNAVDNKHGYTEEDFEDESPYEIVSIVINDGDESYPVISETDDDTELKCSKAYSKYLVLPWATYELTPECKLWMKMKDMGIINKDAPFDFDKYHTLVDDVK